MLTTSDTLGFSLTTPIKQYYRTTMKEKWRQKKKEKSKEKEKGERSAGPKLQSRILFMNVGKIT